jgi:hypothetical protein
MRAYVRRFVIVALVVGTFANFVFALRAEELDRRDTRLAKCTGVADGVLDVIATKLNAEAEGGILRYGHTVQQADKWFVSAQLRRPDRPGSAPGDILTWVSAAAPTAPASDYLAVDANARKFADWPASDPSVTVRLDGAIDSRACVHESRPGDKGLFH